MKFRKWDFFLFSSSTNCIDFFLLLRERKMILRKFHLFKIVWKKFFFFLERTAKAKSVPGCLQMGCYCCRSNIRVCIGWNNQNIILRLEKHALMDRRRLRLSPRSRTNYPYIPSTPPPFSHFSFPVLFVRRAWDVRRPVRRNTRRNKRRHRFVPKKE